MMIMNTMEYFEAQMMMGNKVADAIAKFWHENAEMILVGLQAMNGNVYVPANC